MSILEKIRNKSGLAIVFVGGALALFVISDALQSNSRLFGGGAQSTDVGVINGEKIDYRVYDSKVNQNLEATRQQMGPDAQMDQNTMDMVREQTWNQMVNDGVMKDEYEELGIKVTGDELFDLIQGENPHQQILSAPIFQNQQTGQFDRTLVVRFLKDIEARNVVETKKQWLAFEDGLYKEALSKKYYALVRKGVYATSLEAKHVYTNRSKTVDGELLAVNYFTVPDSTITVEDSDLKSYMNKNMSKYAEKERTRKIEFVLFDAVATSEDTLATINWVNEQMTQFATATNDTLYVDANSDDKFDPTPKPRAAYPEAIADRLFRDSVGSIIGPIFENGKYTIYKVVGVKQDSVFQMRASHILFKTENGDTTATIKKANEVMAQIRGGADFGAMAAQYGTDGTAQRGGDLGWFSEGQMVKEFNDAVLAGKKGDMRIVKTQFGIHILKITEDKSKKLVTAGVLTSTIKPSESTISNAYNAASQFASSNTSKESFEKNVTEMGLNKRVADFIRENDKQVAGIQDAREVVRWAYEAQKDDVSEVFSVGQQFMVAVLTTVREKGKADFESVKARVDADYRKEKKAEQLLEKATAALEGANNLQDVAVKLQVSITPLTGQTFDNNNIPYVGPDNIMVGSLFGTKQLNKIVGPVKGDNAVYVYSISRVNASPETADLGIYKNEVQQQLSQRVEYGTFDALKELKKVEDFRFRFN
jgi:peptidyl-prolyl cis-trans isomerase D